MLTAPAWLDTCYKGLDMLLATCRHKQEQAKQPTCKILTRLQCTDSSRSCIDLPGDKLTKQGRLKVIPNKPRVSMQHDATGMDTEDPHRSYLGWADA